MRPSLWIEATNRWDALALTRKLACYRWFLVEPDAQHWDVYVSVEDPGDLPSELAQRVLEWLHERDLDNATVHLAGTELVLSRR